MNWLSPELEYEGRAGADKSARVVPVPAVLHKDFYLKHPEPALQCEEYCYGDLEAAHPVIGRRSTDEVKEYRRVQGLRVDGVRGRSPPKPFQSFRETSFPEFVEELAYELFTTDAKPFPVQAQAWPCALSGMDLVAVAPTGSGKTLAFLLPALVHVMAQPPLDRGDGPIALVLVHTRELAQQTVRVTARFCERTEGDDAIRAGAVFGGVSPSVQVPTRGAPDYGRWAEILIATPGRVLDLISRQWLNPRRISYVVLDEADFLLSRAGFLPQVRAVLAWVRPDRQLLLFAATWPMDSEAAASELCGEELVRIRVEPPMPRIPQAIRLFPGDADTNNRDRRAALVKWLCTDLQAGEVVLVLCGWPHVVRSLASDAEVTAAAGKDGVATLLDGPSGLEGRWGAYQNFVLGKVRVLITTFALGSRGLDYADTTAAAGQARPLSMAVLLFDFPQTIKDYAHCIGRTGRPGQLAGRALSFLPEMRFWIARELVQLLEHCGQPVPHELADLIAKDDAFLADCREAMLQLRDGAPPMGRSQQQRSGGGAACGGDFDAGSGVWVLPPSLLSYQRKLLHWLADEVGLPHVSAGDAPERRLHIARTRSALPDYFFIEGEDIEVQPRRQGDRPIHGVVADPKVHRRNRTVLVRLEDGEEVDIPVDATRPCVGGA